MVKKSDDFIKLNNKSHSNFISHRKISDLSSGADKSLVSFYKISTFKPLNQLSTSHCSLGFTLAEVLITLGIIGIVCAMTIPALMNRTQNLEDAVAAKKAYSMLQQVIQRYKTDNGGSISDAFPADQDSNYSLNQLAPYLHILKKCTTQQVCWTERTKYLNAINNGYGTYSSGGSSLGANYAAAILADGSRITITNNGANTTKSVQCDDKRDSNGNFILDADGKPTPTYCTFTNLAFIYIDTNGAKGPNRFGYDTWEFRISSNSISGCGWGPYEGCIEDVLRTGKIDPSSNPG